MSTVSEIVVRNGSRRAVFRQSEQGWVPDWFYEGERPMLRFKDHEWLSIGHVHPAHAGEAVTLPDGGAVFRHTSHYGRTAVAWSVAVSPDPQGDGFLVECTFTPAASLELLEAYSTFETPYDYDGSETVTTVIGMNPVVRWQGGKRLSPPIPENPAWLYSRPQAARITGPCSTPFLCQALTAAGAAVPDRFVRVIGDWTVCRVRDLYVTPTRSTPRDPAAIWAHGEERRGYKYIVGALNWSSAFAKDPNVLYAGGQPHRQRVVVDAWSELPGGTFDAMLYGAWERTAALSRPADGRVRAAERAARHGASWKAAVTWLRDVYCGSARTEGLFDPDKGICTYAEGSRPKAGGDYGWFWWAQWGGPLHYRARLTGDTALAEVCARGDAKLAEHVGKLDYLKHIGMSVTVLPSVWWVHGGGRGGALEAAVRLLLQRALAASVAENGKPREMDCGAQAAIAEALLLGADICADPAMAAQAQVLLEEMAARLDGNFWEFNVGKAGSLAHGGQVRSLGHGHAVMANLLAWRRTGEALHLARARRFARYLLAINYATHNGSLDPDFDWRGWCNGSNAGRDQIAEFPPWETQNGLLCLSVLLGETAVEPGFYDVLWYIARTGLAQFPAARTTKRILDESMQVRYVPRRSLASERDFYDNLPYLAYENPHDQTLLASYQGTDCVLGEFVYGGGLATCADRRVGVLVPRAATLDLRELNERVVHLWNPTAAPIATTLTVHWTGGSRSRRRVVVPPREPLRLTLAR